MGQNIGTLAGVDMIRCQLPRNFFITLCYREPSICELFEKNIMMRWAVTLFLLALLSQPVLSQSPQENRELHYQDGYTRRYSLTLPEPMPNSEILPLVIALHGAGDSGENFQALSGLDALAHESRVIVAYPTGIQAGWNYLDRSELHPADLYTDDWGFVRALIAELQAEYAIDAERVYLWGFSNGGLLALRALCEYGEELAGIVVIAANFSIQLAQHCLNAAPTTLLLVLGTRDALFPWQGGTEIRAPRRLIMTLSVAQTIGFMKHLNRCTQQSVDPVHSPTSPASVIRDAHTGCQHNTVFELYALPDYPHAYPVQPRMGLEGGQDVGLIRALWQALLAHNR